MDEGASDIKPLNAFAAQMNDPYTYAAEDGRRCFVCGSDQGLNREHIFPLWLLNHCQLHDEPFPLPNGTSIRFRELVLNMCRTCNGIHFGQIENVVSLAVVAGDHAAVKRLGDLKVFLWLAKIFLAVRFKELTLLANRDPRVNAGPMLEPHRMLFAYAVCVMLHAARGVVLVMQKPAPFSVLTVDLAVVPSALPRFRYWDHDSGRMVGVQVGNIGLVAAFGDFGHNQRHYGSYLERGQGAKLDEVQFQELLVRVAYNASLFPNVAPRFGSFESASGVLVADIAYTFAERADWSEAVFMELLRSHIAVTDFPNSIKQLANGLHPANTFLFGGTQMKLCGPSDEVVLVPSMPTSSSYYLPQPELRIEETLRLAKALQRVQS